MTMNARESQGSFCTVFGPASALLRGLTLGVLLVTAWAQVTAQVSGSTTRPSVLVVDTEHVSPTPGGAVTVRGDMHACARRTTQTNPHVPGYFEGSVVVGFDATRNRLLCAARMQLGTELPALPTVVSGTKRSVKCQDDHYVTGVRADRVQALCAPLFNFSTRAAQPLPMAIVDASPTLRSDMPACPRGYGLTGFDEDAGAWTFHCKRFPICWASYGSVPAGGNYRTPCTGACTLRPGAKAGQGTCS
jgi:hypothetical protein